MSIHQLAFEGDFNKVNSILAFSPDQANRFLEFKDDDQVHRITPIYLAAIKGYVGIVELLLKYNAQVTWPDETDHLIDWVNVGQAKTRQSILYLLVQFKKIKFINSVDLEYSQFKLVGAAVNRILSKLSLSNGACYSEEDYYCLLGERAAIVRIKRVLALPDMKREWIEALYTGALSTGRIDILELIHDNQVDCDFVFTKGHYAHCTPAYIAARDGDEDILQFLYSIGTDLSLPNPKGEAHGWTPACIASVTGHEDVIKFLLESGVDFEDHIKEGKETGYTPAYIASKQGHVNILELLHESGVDIKAPLKLGKYKGWTPVFIAICEGIKEVLPFFQKVGVDLDAPLLGGNQMGCTLAYIAAQENHVKVLEYLYQQGVDLLNIIECGNFKGQSALFIAAFHGRIEVLNFFNSHCIFQKTFPQAIKKELKSKAEEAYKKIKPLSRVETALILCRKISNDAGWFHTYSKVFLKYMSDIHSSEWLSVATWDELRTLYRLYMELSGDRKSWLADIAMEALNQSKEGFAIESLFPDLELTTIEDLKSVVRPGKDLLKLLEFVSNTQTILKKSQLTHLESWINAVLKQVSNEPDFWNHAEKFFQKIHAKMKVKPSPKSVKGKGKGKLKAPQDPFKKLWDKFSTKINDIKTPKEELKRVIDVKVQESDEAFKALILQLNLQIEAFKAPFELALSDHDEEREEVQQYVSQIDGLMSRYHSGLEEICCQYKEQSKALDSIQQISVINSALEALHAEKMENTQSLQRQILMDGSQYKLDLLKNLASLKEKREFKQLQMKTSDEVYKQSQREWERFKSTLEEKWKKLLDEQQELINKATTREEVISAGEQSKLKLKEYPEKGILALQGEGVSRKQNSSDHLVQRNECLKSENNRLKKDLKMLEKQVLSRPQSQEKVLPIIEKSNRQALIEKLRKWEDISKKCKKALGMIECEGKILSSVDEMVKFLSLFKIVWINTVGSHKQYSDGKFHVTIANHEGESKPEEIEDVLKTVLAKIS